jgi:hypothetical protein
MIRLKEEFGGRCVLCGYEANYACLDFHHIDAATKLFGVNTAGMSSFGYVKCREEAGKCVLLCRNCHTDQHYPSMRKDVTSRNDAIWIDGLREAMRVTPPPPPPDYGGLSAEQYEEMLDHCDPVRIEARRVAMYQNFI